MDAFHSLWTAPYFAKHSDVPFAMEDFELLTLILSARKWREKNGRIRLAADQTGIDYFRSVGFTHLWDAGIELLPSPEVDPFLFWAAGKLAALQTQTAPIVMLDTDFIVWEPLPPMEASVTVIHRERLDPSVYPSPETFLMDADYIRNPAWDLCEDACNTALCVFTDETMKRIYTDEAFAFMTHLRGGSNHITGMVYAEQRILAMCARANHAPVCALTDLNGLAPGRQTRFTHLWGYKDALRRDASAREAFCRRAAARIVHDFPDERETLRRVPALERYLPRERGGD